MLIDDQFIKILHHVLGMTNPTSRSKQDFKKAMKFERNADVIYMAEFPSLVQKLPGGFLLKIDPDEGFALFDKDRNAVIGATAIAESGFFIVKNYKIARKLEDGSYEFQISPGSKIMR